MVHKNLGIFVNKISTLFFFKLVVTIFIFGQTIFHGCTKFISNLHNDSNDENFAAAETGVLCEFLHMWRQKKQPTVRHDRDEAQHLKRRL